MVVRDLGHWVKVQEKNILLLSNLCLVILDIYIFYEVEPHQGRALWTRSWGVHHVYTTPSTRTVLLGNPRELLARRTHDVWIYNSSQASNHQGAPLQGSSLLSLSLTVLFAFLSLALIHGLRNSFQPFDSIGLRAHSMFIYYSACNCVVQQMYQKQQFGSWDGLQAKQIAFAPSMKDCWI